ncbi:PAS domain-containing sensor histidine kinase [Roseateles sp. PN1]|uniref:PAS domain-containing sensor histidine kinase n=1 Tax=Roseateles sp. PN1 TaxID=3137372 RepID=UPI003138AA11
MAEVPLQVNESMSFRADRRVRWLRLLAALAGLAALLCLYFLPTQRVLLGLAGGVCLTLLVGAQQLARAGVALRQSADRASRSEQRLRLIFDAFPNPVVVSTLAEGRYLEVNPAAAKRLGRERGELIDHTMRDVGVVISESERLLRVRELEAAGQIESAQSRIQLPDGRVLWSLYSARLIELDGVKSAISVSTDITALKQAEEQLRQSEKSFEELFESAPVAMSYSLLGADGLPEASYWNRAWCETFGFESAAVQGRTGVSLNFWIEEAQRRSFLKPAAENKSVLATEVQLRHADGSVRTVVVSARGIDRLGRRQLLASYQDMTQARRAARRLNELAEMVESAHDAMLLIDDGLIVECNEASGRIFGRSRANVLGRSPAELSPLLQDDGRRSDELARVFLSAVFEGHPQRFVWRHLHGDGGSFEAEVSLVAVRAADASSASASAKRCIAVVRDITEARRAAQALAASEQRFRQLFEHSPVALVLLAPGGRLVMVNRVWTSLLGYSAQEVGSIEQWWTLAYPDPEYRARSRERWTAELARAKRAGGEPEAAEYEICCKSGERRHVLIGAAWIGDDLLASFHDITEQKLAQAQLEALNTGLEGRVNERTRELSEALEVLKQAQEDLVRTEKLAGLGALVAGVSHELNTPIGNAVMVASTQRERLQRFEGETAAGLRRSQLSAFLSDAKESAEVVERNLQRAAELVNSFKQVAVDQSSYQRRGFGLQDLLHELSLMLSPTLRRNQVALCEEVPAGLFMDSYPGPMTQVLMNLVNNSVAHAFDGIADERRVRIVASALGADRLRVAVEDNGAGIPAEHLSRVFDPFFTTKLGRGGSGLGLHIVYSLVTELLGGTVRIASSVGKGTRVILELPRAAPGATASHQQGVSNERQ